MTAEVTPRPGGGAVIKTPVIGGHGWVQAHLDPDDMLPVVRALLDTLQPDDIQEALRKAPYRFGVDPGGVVPLSDPGETEAPIVTLARVAAKLKAMLDKSYRGGITWVARHDVQALADEISGFRVVLAPGCGHGCGPMRRMADGSYECISDHK